MGDLTLAAVQNSHDWNRYGHEARIQNLRHDNFFFQGNTDAESSQQSNSQH
ncbi:hypothetical protein BH11CYA1_BH11CYA1_40580 [soil metagenome]